MTVSPRHERRWRRRLSPAASSKSRWRRARRAPRRPLVDAFPLTALPLSLTLLRLIAAPPAIAGASSDDWRVSSSNETLFPGGRVSPDGTCRLALILPFTVPGGERRAEDEPFTADGHPRSESFSHLAAGVMAMQQFNDRDASVVPELASAPYMANCSVQFPISESPVFDTENGVPMEAASFLMGELRLGRQICGIVGPRSQVPSQEVATVAGGMDVPAALYHNIDLPTNKRTPFPTAFRTKADQFYQFDATVQMLRRLGRTDFMNILFVSKLADQSLALESQARELGSAGLPRVRQHKIVAPFTGFVPNQSVRRAVYEMKKSGWRTIYVFLIRWGWDTNPAFGLLADAAEEYGMNNGDYTWFFSSDAQLNVLQQLSATNSNVTKLLRGVGVVRQLDGFDYRADEEGGDPFLRSWKEQGLKLIGQVRGLYPVPSSAPAFYNVSDTYFQDVRPEWESGHFYDSIMSIGLGACKAEFDAKRAAAGSDKKAGSGGKNGSKGKNKQAEAAGGAVRRHLQKGRTTDEYQNQHMMGIVSSPFSGATGMVSYYGGKKKDLKRRRRDTITYGLYNFKEVCKGTARNASGDCSWKFVLTNIYRDGKEPSNGTWTNLPDGPFVFSNGQTTPPKLIDDPEQNYLSSSVRISGLVLMSIAMFLVLASTAFVAWNSSHRVMQAAQPEFLYANHFGALVMTMSILTISFDESYGWTKPMLDAACTVTPWLISLGYIIIYCALFSKLWRINQVLSFHRRTVKVSQVLGPFALFVLAAVVILSVWTAVDPFTWERTTIDEETLESYGRCESDHFLAFAIPLLVLMFAVTALTCIMAYKTKDVSSAYSESSWIFYTIAIQFQVLIVGIPVIVILNDASADASYLGRVLVIWSIPISTVLLIVGPKVGTILFPPKDGRTTRGAAGASGQASVHVSGLSQDLASRVSTRSAAHEYNSKPCVSLSLNSTTVDGSCGVSGSGKSSTANNNSDKFKDECAPEANRIKLDVAEVEESAGR